MTSIEKKKIVNNYVGKQSNPLACINRTSKLVSYDWFVDYRFLT